MIKHVSKSRGLRATALAAALLAGSSIVATAATVTFDFTASGGTVSGGTGFGNVRTFSSGGLTLTVTSWSTTGSGDVLRDARTGWWSGAGLGACNRDEGASCGNPAHQIDNDGARDFVMFAFSLPADPTSVRIDPYGTYDRDVSYFVGTPVLSSVTGLLPTGASLGLAEFDDYSSSSSSQRDVSIDGSTAARTLIFGAGRIDWNHRTPQDGSTDRFKIESLTVTFTPGGPGGAVDPTPAPVPATLPLFAAALVGLGLLRKRSI